MESGISGVSDIEIGYRQSFVIKDNQLYSVGYNAAGILGRSDVADSSNSYDWGSTGLSDVTSLSIGFEHAYAIKNGELWSSGDNRVGQLMRNGTTNSSVFESTGISEFIDVFAFNDIGVLIKNDGSISVVGNNIWGQLGLGDQVDRTSLVDIGEPFKEE